MKRIAPQQSLSEIAADQVREAIVTGVFRLGENISEDKLATRLGISRTPVRDCLALLGQEGLVVVRSKRGSFVFETNSEDIAAICDFRLMLEVQATQSALNRAPAALIADLRATVADMAERLASGDAIGYGRADTAFHQLAFDHCGNDYLRNAYRLINGRIAALRANITAPYEDRRRESFAEHQLMTDHLATGRLDAYATALEVHIGRTRQVYIQALRDGLLGPGGDTNREDTP